LNICDSNILKSLAHEIGLDSQTFNDAINAEADETLLKPLRLSSRMRVFGLPHFQIGRQKFWGFDRLGFALEAAGLNARAYHDSWSGVAA